MGYRKSDIDVDATPDILDLSVLDPEEGTVPFWKNDGTRYNKAPSQAFGRGLLNLASEAALGETLSTVLAEKVTAAGGDASATVVTPTDGSSTYTAADWLRGLGRSDAPTKRGFWANIDGGVNVWRMRDRVFIGDAVNMGDDRSNTNTTWVPNDTAGANWLPRDSQFCVMQDRGGTAISGLSRSSDTGALSPLSTIAVAGFAIIDRASSTGRAFYGDVQFESGASYAYGFEVAAKNKGSNVTTTPYSLQTGVYGGYIVAGGDNSYGGSAANPSNTGILFAKGASTWNRGLVFAADAITGSDGSTGTGVAIEMGKGHIISWRAPGNYQGGFIRSDVSSPASDVGIVFANSAIQMFGVGGVSLAYFIHTASAVNYLGLKNAVASSPVEIDARGTDTNISITLTPKGTGTVNGPSFTATGNMQVGAAGSFIYNGRSQITSPADGVLRLLNAAGTDFARLTLGGGTSSFPAIKRSGADIHFRLADDSAYANATCATLLATTNLLTGSTGAIGFTSRSQMTSAVDGRIQLSNAANNDFGLLQFGGSSSSFPGLKRSTTALQARLADDSDFTALQGKLRTHVNYASGAPTPTGYLIIQAANGTEYKIPAEAA